jgi:excisionase family DNA binding protein
MSRYIISQLTPHCCTAVGSQKEQPKSVLLSVEELLRLIRRQNCSASENSQVEQETLKSAEWLKLMTELERAKIGEATKKTQGPEAVSETRIPFRPNSSDKAGAVVTNSTEIQLSTKLASPQQFPTLTVSEAAEALNLSRATIYRMLEHGRLKRANLGAEYGTRRAARVTTESVVAALRPEF